MSLRYRKSDEQEPPKYLDDCQRIQSVLRKKGYEVSLHECERMWEAYSDSYEAGWLILPDEDDSIADALIE